MGERLVPLRYSEYPVDVYRTRTQQMPRFTTITMIQHQKN